MPGYLFRCPECQAEVSLSARRLLVRVDEGTSGEVVFTCLGCARTVALALDPAAVAMLVTGGVSHVSLSAQGTGHPELPPHGPPLTHDDLIDLHMELTGDGWLDRAPGSDG